MRTLIAIPCMDKVHTLFMMSLLNLNKPEGTEISISESSLVYDARNALAKKALDEGFDRILWIDSDMRFDADLLTRLSARLDEGRELVCGLFFSRREPVQPCMYKFLGLGKDTEGVTVPKAISCKDYPENAVFEIEGCGFGAVMMTVDLLRRCGPSPFYPAGGFGEDFTFCLKARDAGAKLWCDSSIAVDHIGQILVNEKMRRERKQDGWDNR